MLQGAVTEAERHLIRLFKVYHHFCSDNELLCGD